MLTDSIGMFLLLAILWATLEGRNGLYLLAMAAAVATRENLLVLTGFHALHLVRMGRAGWLRSVALLVIPWGLFLVSRRWPLFMPRYPEHILGTMTSIRAFLWQPLRQYVVAVGHVNALGVLAILPALHWRGVVAFLRDHYEWGYYLLATSVSP